MLTNTTLNSSARNSVQIFKVLGVPDEHASAPTLPQVNTVNHVNKASLLTTNNNFNVFDSYYASSAMQS